MVLGAWEQQVVVATGSCVYMWSPGRAGGGLVRWGGEEGAHGEEEEEQMSTFLNTHHCSKLSQHFSIVLSGVNASVLYKFLGLLM